MQQMVGLDGRHFNREGDKKAQERSGMLQGGLDILPEGAKS
jgi:hypothetical protein